MYLTKDVYMRKSLTHSFKFHQIPFEIMYRKGRIMKVEITIYCVIVHLYFQCKDQQLLRRFPEYSDTN